jgi:hypothetical protein
MMHDFPGPEEILEELSDKVALQVDRLAPIAFDKAFREMDRYHRFLLALSASKTAEGAVFSYAELTGDAWNAPHRKWIGQYRRLFERAMDRLPDDDHFIRSLSYACSQLLPRTGDPELPPDVVSGILDLAPIMIHRIEAWVTKRTTITNTEEQAPQPRLALAGSDAKAYTNVLHAIVGDWESVLQQAPSIYKWPDRSDQDAAKTWSAFRASWPFLWEHLSNTAYCVAAAVWNEDEAASALYRESLVRWRGSLSYRLHDSADLRWRRLLFPTILDLDWPEASALSLKVSYDYVPAPTPSQLFASVLDGVHEDVMLLTSAILLYWTIEKKQATDIAGRNATELLRGEDNDQDAHRPRRQRRGFRSLFLDVFRLELAGERVRDGTYATQLDRFVHALDNMTERRIVPGRIYTPSTLQDRDDLLRPFVAMLMAVTPKEGSDGFLDRVSELAREENVLPGGDRSLRNLIHQLERLGSVLERPQPQLGRGLALLAPDRHPEEVARQLRQLVGAAKAAIDEQRLDRLKARPIDFDRLERIRAAIETALLNDPSEAPFFRAVKIGRLLAGQEAIEREIVFNGVSKAQFTKPPMEAISTHFEEQFVSRCRERAGMYAWEDFCGRTRVTIRIEVGPENEAFWHKIRSILADVGTDATLVLSRAESQSVRRLMRAAPADRFQLKIERRQRNDSRGSYVGTVEDVDVFSSAFSPGVAWLFSASALRGILYGRVDDPERYVAISFDPGDKVTDALHVRVRQQFEWSDAPIFEIKFPEQPKSQSGI